MTWPREDLSGIAPIVLEGFPETVEENFYRYVVTRDAEGFAAELSRNGATVTSVVPLGLREIFLYLVRKEQSCTSGNAGVTPVLSSSSLSSSPR